MDCLELPHDPQCFPHDSSCRTNVPIKIIIDEMQLKLEVTGTPTEKDFVELNPEDYGYTGAPAKTEKCKEDLGRISAAQCASQCIRGPPTLLTPSCS